LLQPTESANSTASAWPEWPAIVGLDAGRGTPRVTVRV
jgi:hypothetical protein